MNRYGAPMDTTPGFVPIDPGFIADPYPAYAVLRRNAPVHYDEAIDHWLVSRHADVHGFATMKDLMNALNPLTGKIYLESLEYTRVGRIMCMQMYGKYPHPSTLVPGGVSTTT